MELKQIVETVSGWCKNNWGILLGVAVLVLVIVCVK